MKLKFLLVLFFFSSVSLRAKPLELPIIKVVSPLIITSIRIGAQDYKFLIDSGSNASFIDSSVLESLRGSLTRTPKLDTYVNTFGGRIKSEAYAFQLKIKGFNFGELPAFVMNTKKFKKKLDGIDCCDGILGIDFIKAFPMEIDIVKQKITIYKSTPNKAKWKVLPIKLIGKNVLTFTCQSNGNEKFKFRLDTGSEAPLIFHKAAVDKHKLREQAFAQGFSGSGLPFFELKKVKCGELEIDPLISTFFYTGEGALSHKFVDGNAGAHLLGEQYLYDLKAKRVLVRGKPIPFILKSKKYKFENGFKFKKGHRSVIHQAQTLILKSCVEASSYGKCMKKFCVLGGKKLCVFKDTGDFFSDFINFLYPQKAADCSVQRLAHELRTRPVLYNYCWYKLSELNQEVYPKSFKEVTLGGFFSPYVKEIRSLEVTNPITLTKDFYCYSIFQKIIKQESLPAGLFGLSVKGLSLSSIKLSDYKKWLGSKKGRSCSQHIKNAVGVHATSNLEHYFKKKYLTLINPFTLLGDGLREWKYNYKSTLNHEALHSVYAIDPKFKRWASVAWSKLDVGQQDSFIKAHSSYNFKSEDTLLREYFSYQFEDDPSFLESVK